MDTKFEPVLQILTKFPEAVAEVLSVMGPQTFFPPGPVCTLYDF